MKRRIFLAGCGITLQGAAISSRAANEAGFPNKPIRIVVPFAAGISPDIIARLLGEKISRSTSQPVLVDNRPGAAGVIGAEAAATSAPDGYTIFLTATSVMAINPHVYARLKYNPLVDFMPVSHVLTVPYVLSAAPNAPFGSMRELVAYAKRHPGEVTYASLGVGSQPHVAMELWQKQLGISLNHVSYKSSPANDLMGGFVSLYLDASTVAIPLVRGQKVKAIAVSSAQRIESLPEVPAAAEYDKRLVTTAWQGFFAPKGTPADVVQKLATEISRAVATPDVQARMRDLGLVPTGTGPAELANALAQDHALWGNIVRDLGIRV
jgi:tripartite-type tricarboxylate transporter receptor subunit TctC